jgi:uncharacterized membrane protein YedE/YeeE
VAAAGDALSAASPTGIPAQARTKRGAEALRMLGYLLVGAYFGIVLIKGQVADWFRIQEMFHLAAFHMFGIIGSAIVVAAFGYWLLRKLGARSSDGALVAISDKTSNKGQIYGGILFGFGWAIVGACPGPLYALVGAGFPLVIALIGAALAGTWTYGLLQSRLPH